MFTSVADRIPVIEEKLRRPITEEERQILDGIHYRLIDDIASELMAANDTRTDIEDVLIERYLRRR